MLVRATEVGFYVKLRAVDDEFQVPDDFKARWVVRVDQAETGASDTPKRRRGRPRKQQVDPA